MQSLANRLTLELQNTDMQCAPARARARTPRIRDIPATIANHMLRLQATFMTSGLSSHLKRASQHFTAEKLHCSFFMTGGCLERGKICGFTA